MAANVYGVKGVVPQANSKTRVSFKIRVRRDKNQQVS